MEELKVNNGHPHDYQTENNLQLFHIQVFIGFWSSYALKLFHYMSYCPCEDQPNEKVKENWPKMIDVWKEPISQRLFSIFKFKKENSWCLDTKTCTRGKPKQKIPPSMHISLCIPFLFILPYITFFLVIVNLFIGHSAWPIFSST